MSVNAAMQSLHAVEVLIEVILWIDSFLFEKISPRKHIRGQKHESFTLATSTNIFQNFFTYSSKLYNALKRY